MKDVPRVAVALVRRFVPETVTGDLVEEYVSRRHSAWWFWKQTLSLVFAYAVENGVAFALVEFRRGARHALRSPGFALSVALVLGLAIGANGLMFAWVHHEVLAPPPFPDSDELVRIVQMRDADRDSLSPPNFFDLAELETLDGAAGYWSPSVTWTGAGEAETLRAATVSHTLFRVLGVEPMIGRGFTADDDAPGGPLVAVLGHGRWQRRLGSDRGVLERELELDGRAVRIVGVAPPRFDFPREGTELWIPLRMPRTRPDRGGTPYRAFRILNVVARVADGVSFEQASRSVESLGHDLARAYPASNAGFSLQAYGLHDDMVAAIRGPLFFLWAAMGAVMLIACANVSGLLLARTAARRRELALRMGLGASRFRVAAQLGLESLALSVASGAVASLVLFSGLRVLGVPFFLALAVYVLGAVVLAALLLGLGPALLAFRGGAADALRQSSRVSSTSGTKGAARARTGLVVFEIALALLLLMSASLLLRSFHALRGLDRGFTDSEVFYAQVEVPIPRYRDNTVRVDFFRALIERLGTGPGVTSASLSLGLPLDPRAEFFVTRSPFQIDGKPEPPTGQKPEAALHVVDRHFFDVLSVPFLAGRDFDERDDASSLSVVIVNEQMAERFWPGEDPVGRFLTHDLTLLPEDSDARRRVVGVVSNLRYYELAQRPEPQMYIPFAQTPWPQMHVVLKSSAEADALQLALGEAMRSLDDTIPVPRLRALESVTAGAVAEPRRRASLLTAFAAAALLLAAIGLYAVMAYSVVERRHEIGVRVALGAKRREILSLVFLQGLKLVGGGLVLGVAGTFLVTPWIESLLFGVGALDVVSYGAVATLLLMVAAAATYVPARRATKVDPIVTLRAE